METSPVYPYRSVPFDLERVVGNSYPYSSPANHANILSQRFSKDDLTNRSIDVLARQFTPTSHPQLFGDDSYYVLREGCLTDIEHALGKLLIAIEYNFRNNKPRIRIIGKKRRSKRRSKKTTSNGEISVKLLTITNFRRFVKRYLRRDDSQGQESYTGEYEGIAKRKGIPEIVTEITNRKL